MRRILALLVLGLMAGACGGGGSSTAGFCEDLGAIEGDLASIASGGGEQLGEAVERLREVDPPGEIEDEFGNVVDVYGEIASDSGAVTDPAMANRIEDARADAEAVESFVAEECSASE